MASQQEVGTVMSGAEDVVERLLGIQVQVPNNPYVGLWSRIEGFNPEAPAPLLATRRSVYSAGA